MALAPTLPASIAAPAVYTLCTAPIIAGPSIVLSLAAPPRMRSSCFSVAGLYFLPGLLLVAIVGVIADAFGFTAAFLSIIPIMLLGVLVLWSGRRFIDADVARMRAESLAAAQALLDAAPGTTGQR
ncbi:hypothetical protein [Streptosporangium sp. NPDC002607]